MAKCAAGMESGAEIYEATTDGYSWPSLYVTSLNGHTDCAPLLIESQVVVDRAIPIDGTIVLLIEWHNGHVDCELLSRVVVADLLKTIDRVALGSTSELSHRP